VPYLAFDRGFIASQRPDLAWLARRHVDSAEGEQWIRGNAAIRWCDAGQMANAQASLDDWLEPELATLTRDRFFSPDWIYERKFDGERCLAYHSAGSVRLMTRNRQNVNGTYPEIADALLGQRADGFVIDGEVVAMQAGATSFSRLQQRLGVRSPSAQLIESVPVTYFAFDVLRTGGDDVRHLTLRERKKILRPLLSYGGAVRFTVHRTRDGQAYWDHAQRSGWEGLVVKRADSPYTGGRSRDWLKFKAENSQEFVIGGFTDPQGSRSGFGALLIGYYDEAGKLAYAGKVGTGFDQETLANLHATLAGLTQPQTSFSSGARPRTGAHWVRPVLVCQVGFSEWTTAGQLRHPRYLGLRRDKDPGSVTRERPE
jgi:bifunctional non-homologous end joining protein LigD